MNGRTLLIAALVLIGVLALLPMLAPPQQPVLSSWPGSGVSSAPASAPVIRGAAAPEPTADTTTIASSIDAYLGGLTASSQFSGAVLVAKSGTVILAKGYGVADAASQTPNTPDTRLRLASVSKQFTAMAVMQLVAEDRIELDGPACDYVPNCPATWGAISIRHLLTHTSGLPNFTDFGSYEATMAQPTSPEALVGRFRDVALLSEPGTTYRYGNSGYVLLGYIVEQVSGQSYGDFLRDHIFQPLGMNDSGYDLGGANVAQGFDAPGVPAEVLHASTLFSSGGLYSSVHDLYRWDQALYTPKLLPDNLRAEIFSPQAGNYGFGWIMTQRGGQRTVEHPGLMSGAATFIARQPETRVTVIVLSNLYTANVEAIGNQLIAFANT